jgi:hypothetical protein
MIPARECARNGLAFDAFNGEGVLVATARLWYQ